MWKREREGGRFSVGDDEQTQDSSRPEVYVALNYFLVLPLFIFMLPFPHLPIAKIPTWDEYTQHVWQKMFNQTNPFHNYAARQSTRVGHVQLRIMRLHADKRFILHMGQFLQYGKKVQIMSKKIIFETSLWPNSLIFSRFLDCPVEY